MKFLLARFRMSFFHFSFSRRAFRRPPSVLASQKRRYSPLWFSRFACSLLGWIARCFRRNLSALPYPPRQPLPFFLASSLVPEPHLLLHSLCTWRFRSACETGDEFSRTPHSPPRQFGVLNSPRIASSCSAVLCLTTQRAVPAGRCDVRPEKEGSTAVLTVFHAASASQPSESARP